MINAGIRVGVVGGGIVGLWTAWWLSRAGHEAAVYDDGAAHPGTSPMAGGMLAPFSEAWPGEETLLDLGERSLELWRQHAHPELICARGTVNLAADAADQHDLRLMAHGSEALEMRSDLADIEPELARRFTKGGYVARELAVHPEAVLAWLRDQLGSRRLHGSVASLMDVDADHVVLAAGVYAPQLLPRLPIRPVKGEILTLRERPGSPSLAGVTVRARVHGRQVYIVPRPGGAVVGATQYEHGFDRAPTVHGVRELLDDACVVLPALGEYELVQVTAGLRPMTPDGLPLVGRYDDRVIVAAGHGRSGFLLAPWTARAVESLIHHDPLPELTHTDLGRFL